METEKHFSQKAEEYDKKRSEWILGKLVSKEKKQIIKTLDPNKGEEILDAGSGSGFYGRLIKKQDAKPYCIDISKGMIEVAKQSGLKGEVQNLDNFNLKKKFNKILCAGALEFTQNPNKVISNLKKHLKKEGFIILLYPRLNFFGILYKIFHLTHKVKIHLFSNKKIERICQENKLKIIETHNTQLFTKVIKISHKN